MFKVRLILDSNWTQPSLLFSLYFSDGWLIGWGSHLYLRRYKNKLLVDRMFPCDIKEIFIELNLRKKQVHKQPSRGVPRKTCSENRQQIYWRTPMPKCHLYAPKCLEHLFLRTLLDSCFYTLSLFRLYYPSNQLDGCSFNQVKIVQIYIANIYSKFYKKIYANWWTSCRGVRALSFAISL